jgi:hypothetical protein
VALALADVNGDATLDLMVANAGADTVSVYPGQGDATFGPKIDFATGSEPRALALADLNRDGRLDLVVANTGADRSRSSSETATARSTQRLTSSPERRPMPSP